MKNKLTQEKIDKYIQSPNHCIYCDSDNIESPSSENEQEETEMSANVYCNNCHRNWKEVYTLTTIKEIGND